jgi:hypothetical protein
LQQGKEEKRMNILKQRLARFGVGIGLATVMALSAVVPALASPGDIVVENGTISASIGTIATTGGVVTRNGSAQDRTLSGPITVADYRKDSTSFASSDGWSITLNMTKFLLPDTTTDMGAPAVSISSVNGTCTSSPVALCSEQGANALTNLITSVATLVPGGTGVTDDSSVFAVPVGKGTGQYTFSPVITVTVPATAPAGTYTSLLTVTTAATP